MSESPEEEPWGVKYEGLIYNFPPLGEYSPEVLTRCEAIKAEILGIMAAGTEDRYWLYLAIGAIDVAEGGAALDGPARAQLRDDVHARAGQRDARVADLMAEYERITGLRGIPDPGPAPE